MPTALIGSAVSGVTSVLGGLIGSHGAHAAADQQANAIQKGADYIGTNTKQALGVLDPYKDEGAQGIDMLNQAIKPGGSLAQQFNFNPSDLANDPGYQFQLQQGLTALNNAASARGLATSGGTLKDITAYGQGLASTQFNQAYNRALTTFQTNRSNTLGNITAQLGLGQFGAQTQNQDLMGSGQSIAGLYAQKGQAQASGTMGAANAWSGALGGVGNAAQNYSTLSSIFPQQPSAPSGFQYYGGAQPFVMPPSYAGSVQIGQPPAVGTGAEGIGVDPNVLKAAGIG